MDGIVNRISSRGEDPRVVTGGDNHNSGVQGSNQTGAGTQRRAVWSCQHRDCCCWTTSVFFVVVVNLKRLLAKPGLPWRVRAFCALLAGARSTVVQARASDRGGAWLQSLGVRPSGAVRRRLSCSAAREPFQPEVEPVSPASVGRFLPTAPWGKSRTIFWPKKTPGESVSPNEEIHWERTVCSPGNREASLGERKEELQAGQETKARWQLSRGSDGKPAWRRRGV